MKKSSFLILLLVTMILTISAVSAAEIDDKNETVASIDASVSVENDFKSIDKVNEDATDGGDIALENDVKSVAVSNNDGNDLLSVDNDENGNVLKDNVAGYDEFKKEIVQASSATIVLKHKNYKFDSGETITLDQPRTIDGKGATIDMNKQGFTLFLVNKNQITIKNLIIENMDSSTDSGTIKIGENIRCTIENCTFINNHGYFCGGIYHYEYSTCIITDCTFVGNSGDYGGAIDCYGPTESKVTNCVFVNNSGGAASAINGADKIKSLEDNWWGSNNPNWEELTNYQSPSRYAVLNLDVNPDEILTTGTSGITTKFVWNTDGTDATSALPKRNIKLTTDGNLTKSEGNVGLTSLFSASNDGTYFVKATVDNQELEVNVKVGGYEPKTIYVDASAASGGNGKSKETAFKTLKEALTEAKDQDTIMIASGTYKGSDNAGLTIDKKLYFEKYGNGEAVLDAQSDSRIFEVTASSISINGLTFQNGHADNGGAIYFENPIFNSNINATFINNTATGNGGANYFGNTLTDVNITGNYINNAALNGGANYFGNTLTDVNIIGTYTENKATGDGGANIFKGTVTNVNIAGNYINNTAASGGYGGANYFGNTLTDVNIIGNYSGNEAIEGDAGANTFEKGISNVYITGNYSGNKAYYDGGANIFKGSVTNVNITGNYVNNTANNGGANDFRNKLTNVSMTGNYINNTGNNVIHISESVSNNVIHDSIFLNNDVSDKIISINTNNVQSINNWFGNNATNYNKAPNAGIDLDNWLFLNATANPSEIGIDESSKIVFKLQSYKNSQVSDYDASKMNIRLNLNQTLGELDKTTALLGEEITYTAKEKGDTTVTGKFETASYTINLNKVKIPTTITVTNSTVALKVNGEVPAGASLTPADAGNLTYTSSNSSVAIVEGGKIKALGEGSAVITVSFAGNEQYAAAENKTIDVTVTLNDAIVSVNNSTVNLLIDETFTINATTKPAGLKVTYIPDNSGIVKVDDKGLITALKEGTATITVKVGGDGTYTENTTTVTVTVSKIPTEITLKNETIGLKVNEEVPTGATLTPADAGNLTYTSSNSSVAIVENGKIKALAKGTAVITVSFQGNDKYAPAKNKTITVNVGLKDAIVSVNNSTVDLFINDTFTIVATTNPTGLKVTYIPDNSGIVKVDDKGLITALKEGTATITVKVGGDGTYAENTTTVTVTVNKISTEITVNPSSLDLTVGETGEIVANLTPSQAGSFKYNSSDEKIATVELSSEGSLVVKGISEGKATITVSFQGNDKYAPSNNTVTVSVKSKEKIPTKITASSVKTYWNVAKNLVITLKDNKGNPISGAKVTVSLKTEKTSTTDKNGQIKVSTKSLTPKTYTAKITFKGDSKYAKSTKNVKVTVKKAKSKIVAKKKTFKKTKKIKKYTIKLKNSNKKAIKKVKVTLKVKGKTYKAKTNKKGKATFKITKLTKKGKFTAKIKFKGNKYYKATSKKVKIKVK